MTRPATLPAQVYQIFIKASPERIWDAITQPEFTARYFHGSLVNPELEPGGRYRSFAPDGSTQWIDGEVLVIEPGRKLVHTWRSLYSDELAAEAPSRVTWEIESRDGGYCLLTVIHDQLEGAPKTAASVSGGWMFVLSGLKTLLETGEPLSSR